MSIATTPYPAQLEFHADREITRWRPLVQWLLAIPQLLVVEVLGTLRNVLTLISLFTVVFTKKIPRPLFDAIVMTYRYEWRVMSYALFMHQDYPPFDFRPSATDDGAEPHTILSLTYPEPSACSPTNTLRSHFARSSQSRDRHGALRLLGIKVAHLRSS